MNIKYYSNEQLMDAVRNPELLDAYRKACKEELQSRVNFKIVSDDL
tara:strand:- start:233 stop:370 length:138 start_codon:yes stop_codon:yes gene_type:complete